MTAGTKTAGKAARKTVAKTAAKTAAKAGARKDGRSAGPPPSAAPSDDSHELNARIIQLLQQDGRMPYSMIAASVGVSEGTVRNRVRQLIDDNIISIQAEALPEAFGYGFNALTFINVAQGADLDALIARLHDVPEVFYLIMTLGRFDVGVATYHRSHDDYREFLTAHCYGKPDIGAVETSLVLKVHKMQLQWDLIGNGQGPVLAKGRKG
ncbi:Lrp/AsnC family transcriptional regulator [Sphingosinicella rhizophila]|uniref:Lrp/AsnC family transcriptional regulator n=1 Tax=Sphingosinicella rhizophila TaxID=3050082 RepID=A0ABU3Q885_9SPHN|nr:Lrp/AsnC family transcriptional regulator [Sphingosinicella sp. GR2756]MDT9599140.1 Lrp/AsnC family transcriptional regulator [Sphingosinicella sp. GR2756]